MAGFNSSLHPHVPAGSASGGQFAPKAASSKKTTAKPAAKKKPAARKGVGTAKGKAPQKTGKNGQYTPAQFRELQSLQRQHAKGKKLTAAQAKALHTAHELHLAHLRHEGKAAAVKVKGAVRRKAAPKPARKKTTMPKMSKPRASGIGHRG